MLGPRHSSRWSVEAKAAASLCSYEIWVQWWWDDAQSWIATPRTTICFHFLVVAAIWRLIHVLSRPQPIHREQCLQTILQSSLSSIKAKQFSLRPAPSFASSTSVDLPLRSTPKQPRPSTRPLHRPTPSRLMSDIAPVQAPIFDMAWLASMSGDAISLVRTKLDMLPVSTSCVGDPGGLEGAGDELSHREIAQVIYISRNDSSVRRVLGEGRSFLPCQ